MKELIRKLAECYGPSGNETMVSDMIATEVRPFVDDVRTDAMGNLVATRNGDGPTLMLTAHMDEIGVIVTHIDEKGYLRFGPVGGVNPIVLPGHRLAFGDGTIGVVGWERRESPRDEVKIEKLFIDIGATDKASAREKVNIGAVAVFADNFVQVNGRCIGKAMDDRIGCAILVKVLEETAKRRQNVVCVFTVQEELGTRGAITSAYRTQPDIAIAVDVTTVGDTPEARRMAVSLGGGPAVKLKDHGMLAHPKVKTLLTDVAMNMEIPFQLEVLEHGTTDAAAIQVSRSGVPAGVVSIPCRYVHTPGEMIDLIDADNAVRLLVGAMERVK